MLYERPVFRPMGDRALLVELGEGIFPFVNQKVRELFLSLLGRRIPGVLDLVPSYRSLLLVYDPLRVCMTRLKDKVLETYGTLDLSRPPETRTIRIPVCYGGEFGPDLEWVARYHGIAPEEVVRLHAGPLYQVYMIGFSPGFPYMGELPEALATPRRETPRTSVPKGSVAIAQRQTGIYSVQSPGGWQVLGRTPLQLFDPEQNPPTLLEMGDRVQFYPIREAEWVAPWTA